MLTGAEGAARGQFNEGFDRASNALQSGYGQATDAVNRGYTDQQGFLQGGYDTARGDVNSSIDAQLAALRQGYDTSVGAVGTGYDTARQDFTGQSGRAESALTDAQSYVQQILTPFMQSGQRAQGLYDTALGLDGQPAAQNFYETYAANDPFRQFNEDMTNKALARSFNAGGSLGSGRAGLAASRANLERGSQDLNKYLDRLAGQGQQGGAYASQLANTATNTGQNLANIRQNLGSQLGTLEQNRGSAMSNLATNYGMNQGNAQANRGTLNANLATGYGTAAGNVAGQRGAQLGNMAYGYGGDQANLATARGGANSDLTYGLAQQRANMQIGKGNSIANMQTQSANNLLQFGAAVIGAGAKAASGGR
jgi:hypothetical protein